MRPRHLQARGRRHEHDFDKERAREFADNGFLQRLKILARCGRSSSRRRTVRFFRTAREQISYGVLDPRCFANEGGTPIAEAIFKGGATFCVREFQHDPGRLEDLDTTREDHAPDDWRYACNSRPWAKPTPKKPGGRSNHAGRRPKK